jgi:hypothetical protein
MGTLPLPDPNTLLASITFKVKASEDCAIIVNNSCNSVISVSGTINGTGLYLGLQLVRLFLKVLIILLQIQLHLLQQWLWIVQEALVLALVVLIVFLRWGNS